MNPEDLDKLMTVYLDYSEMHEDGNALREATIETIKTIEGTNITVGDAAEVIEHYAERLDWDETEYLGEMTNSTLEAMAETNYSPKDVEELIKIYTENADWDMDVNDISTAVNDTLRSMNKNKQTVPKTKEIIKLYTKHSWGEEYITDLSDATCRTLDYMKKWNKITADIEHKMENIDYEGQAQELKRNYRKKVDKIKFEQEPGFKRSAKIFGLKLLYAILATSVEGGMDAGQICDTITK